MQLVFYGYPGRKNPYCCNYLINPARDHYFLFYYHHGSSAEKEYCASKSKYLAELHAMERERARIAADLHDDLGPMLSVTKFRVDYAHQSNVVEKEELEKASEQLDSLIGRIREIANNLMPSALQRKGLIPALEEFIGRVEGPGNIRIQFDHSLDTEISDDQQIQIYRTVQELVHNCIKHAFAKNVDLKMKNQNGQLLLSYKDDGKGFDVEKLMKESTGIGLKSLKNRTEIMGGEMTAESQKGKGTAFVFRIPI